MGSSDAGLGELDLHVMHRHGVTRIEDVVLWLGVAGCVGHRRSVAKGM